MRKIALIAAFVTASMLMTACGGNNASGSSSNADNSASQSASAKTPAEKTAELLTAVELPEMAEVSADNMTIFYKIDAADVTEFSAYVAGAGAYPDEFGVFVAKDADTAAAIKTKLEERIEKQKKTYESYSPDEMYKFDEAFVEVNGSVVAFAVCADGDTASDILS